MYYNSWGTSDGKIILEVGNTAYGASASTNASVVTISPVAWQHVILVVDRATGTATIYHNATDGTTDSTISLQAGAAFNVNSSLVIGAMKDGHYFDGTINEVAIWNEELTSSEITALYNSGNGLNAYVNSTDYT